MSQSPQRPHGFWELQLLRALLLLSGLLIVVGSALSLSQAGVLPDGIVILRDLVPALRDGDDSAIMSAGFLVLIVIPLTRLLTAAGRFAMERNWQFAGTALAVLAIVVSGLVIGRH
jgi:uncharacterized membrane protein